MESEIPKFVRLRGCINCEVSKEHKEKHGKDYGFDHELVICCLISGCFDYGHAIYKPFFDPEELIREARKPENQKYIENVKRYVLSIKEKFGEFYEKMGVNLDDLLQELN